MIFCLPHHVHMVFNTPTLQCAYKSWYGQLRDTKSDFIMFHNIFGQMRQKNLDSSQSALLLQLLVDLCLRTFQKDVFSGLQRLCEMDALQSPQVKASSQGDVPLTLNGISSVFQNANMLHDKIHFVTSPRKIKDILVLFTWLWDWDQDGATNVQTCKHWGSKAYWELFCESFVTITNVFGLQQALEW